MKQTRRTVYRGGYLKFENFTYQNDDLADCAGENIIIRYDPDDITTVWVYRREMEQDKETHQQKWSKEVFLAPVYLQDFETERISLEEAREIIRALRKQGKAINNQSVLDEVRDREAFLEQKKKTKRDRQKEEKAMIQPPPSPIKPIDSVETQPLSSSVRASGSDTTQSPTSTESTVEIPVFEIWDFDEE